MRNYTSKYELSKISDHRRDYYNNKHKIDEVPCEKQEQKYHLSLLQTLDAARWSHFYFFTF